MTLRTITSESTIAARNRVLEGAPSLTYNGSIVAVNSYSIILKPEYRDRGRGSPAQQKGSVAGAQAPFTADKDNQFKKRGKSGSSGGAASWFLFILKVGPDELLGKHGSRYSELGSVFPGSSSLHTRFRSYT